MSTLFRQEAIDARRLTSFGNVTIHQPVAYGVVTSAIVGFTVIAIIFAATATFSKKQAAPGWIVPQGGMAGVYGAQGALVRALMVRPGERVAKGQILAVLSTDTSNALGMTGEQEGLQISVQERYIDAQVTASRNRLSVSSLHAQDQIKALKAEAEMLRTERQLQVDQLQLAQQQLKDVEPLVGRGFISKFERDRRRQEALALQQAVSGVDRQIRDREAQATTAASDLADASSRQATEEAQLRAAQSSLRVNRITIDSRVGATLRAPISGVVASINDQIGETVQASLPVVSIAPVGAIGAELLLPTRSAGLIQNGQSVRLHIDAFPYQRYGSLRGRIVEMGRAAVVPTEYAAPITFKEPSYRIRVRILSRLMNADGRKPEVKVGMTLSGDIIADKRTVLQWLTDPLHSR